MSQAQTTLKGAGPRSGGKIRSKNSRKTDEGGTSPQRKPPFSPGGRHGELRALILSVGNVLARDEENLLSRVSLSGLRAALSGFLVSAGQDERESLAAGTSRSAGAGRAGEASRGQSRETSEQRERRVKRLKRVAQDQEIIERMRAYAREAEDYGI